MTDRLRGLRKTTFLYLLPVLVLLGACSSDSTGPVDPPVDPVYQEIGVVVNSVERSLTLFSADDPEDGIVAKTVGVGPEGSPVNVAVRDHHAVVPLGTYPFAAIVDLIEGEVTHTVALPEESGATGVAFLNDSIALVGNSMRNSVSPVNVRRGTVGEEIDVGVYPEEIVAFEGTAYVLNAELDLSTWEPAGPGSVTVIDEELNVTATIELSGLNPEGAALGADGRLYVLHAGTFGAGNGSLSAVDLTTGTEVAHHEGFGEFPGSIAVAPSGTILVGLYGDGIVEWDPSTETFTHASEDPWTPGGIPPVASLAFDSEGRLFVTNPGDCMAPGQIARITADGETAAEVATGVCPMELVFTEIELDS